MNPFRILFSWISVKNATSEYLKQEMNSNFEITDPSNLVYLMSFSGAKTFLTDSLVWTDEVIALDYYQPECNLFLSVVSEN